MLIFLNRHFHPDHSATGQILSDLAFHLAAAGREVHVITSRQTYDDPKADLDREETVRGVAVHRIRTSQRGRGSLIGRAADQLPFHSAAGPKLAALAARGDIIVAKTDPPLVSVLAAQAARLRGARLVNWLQDIYPEAMVALGLSLPGAQALARLRDGSLRAASANVAIGHRMAERLIALGVRAESVRVIPNWADDRAIRPLPAEDNELRAAWGLSGKFVVGYSGNLGRAHEIGTVLAAAELLRERGKIVFLFIGEGHHRAELEAEAARRGLGNMVFRPYQKLEALAESLSVPDVHWVSLRPELEGLIVPSKFYGIAAAGRPIITVTAPDGELARLVAAHQCGFAVPVGEGARFAEAIGTLAADPAMTRELGRRSRAMLDAHFSRAEALRRWTDLIEELEAAPSVRLGAIA